MPPAVGVVIVTHNSDKFMPETLSRLSAQTVPVRVVVVDSGSTDTQHLKDWCTSRSFELLSLAENVGFCRGNNVGAARLMESCEYILFLNPDCFLPPEFCEQAIEAIGSPENQKIGLFTARLRGYDISAGAPTGRLDSTGIFRNWYGKWFDRDQGRLESEASAPNDGMEPIDAACGALMLCRTRALKEALLNGTEVFDERFFMYKEDIDLSRRLARMDWRVVCSHAMYAYHCRGWNSDRSKMPRISRLRSARNEIRINWRENPICAFYSLAKYAAVRLLNV